MTLAAPDILIDACTLSPGLLGGGLAVGLALWLLGWRCHRFWVVLAVTLVGGLFGLHEGPALGASPMLAAVLLGLAAGVLALALVRLLAFLAGGWFGLVLLQNLAPQVEQPLAAFVICGLAGLLLFRWCVMALTSLAGALVMFHAGLALLHVSGKIDAPAWLEGSGGLPDWIIGLGALLGFACQFLQERRRMLRDHVAVVVEEGEGWGFKRRGLGFGRFRKAG